VNDDVLDAVQRFFDEFEIEPDAAILNIATAPFSFHLFDSPFIDFYTSDRAPFID